MDVHVHVHVHVHGYAYIYACMQIHIERGRITCVEKIQWYMENTKQCLPHRHKVTKIMVLFPHEISRYTTRWLFYPKIVPECLRERLWILWKKQIKKCITMGSSWRLIHKTVFFAKTDIHIRTTEMSEICVICVTDAPMKGTCTKGSLAFVSAHA